MVVGFVVVETWVDVFALVVEKQKIERGVVVKRGWC